MFTVVYSDLKDLTHIPLEDTPDISPTVYEGIPFFVGVKGEVWGIFPGALWAKSLTVVYSDWIKLV